MPPEGEPFNERTLVIWEELADVAALFSCAAFRYSCFSGQIVDVDWAAVEVLLRRYELNPDPQTFADWRVALRGYIEAINQKP